MSRSTILAKAAAACHELGEALAELARDEDARALRQAKSQGPKRRRGVRVPADSPTVVVDDVTAKRAEIALRRAGIITR